MQQITKEDATIVVSAGNYARTPGRKNVRSLPARWASASFPIIVAGSVDNNGAPYLSGQRGPRVTAWAPGVEVVCADRQQSTTKGSGTSVSAGMVKHLLQTSRGVESSADMMFQIGGLVVYFFVLGAIDRETGKTTLNAWRWLFSSSMAKWQRLPPNGPDVIWNGWNTLGNLHMNNASALTGAF